MDFGVHLPHLGRQADRQSLIEFARRADALGYHSAWVSDHITWPAEVASRYPYSEMEISRRRSIRRGLTRWVPCSSLLRAPSGSGLGQRS